MPPEAPVFVPSSPVRVLSLSNSVAEFVEFRAGSEICRRATGDLVETREDAKVVEAALSELKFVAHRDTFMTKDDAPDEREYYQASAEMMKQFEETLKRFTQTLQSRSIFKKLDIQPCDPAKCDIEYVQKVAEVIMEHKEGSEDTKVIKKFMRKCVRGAASNKAAINALLTMIPNDVYGSVISGGFSLILAAVEKHESNRAEIQSILADIPRKLENIRKLSEVAIKFPELHKAADQVFLSIFVVLERVVDKLSLTTTQNVLLKIKGRGSDVKEAIEALGERVKEFQDTANTCSLTMIGRTNERTQRTHSIVQRTDQRVQQVQAIAGRAYHDMKQVHSLVGRTSDGVQEMQTQLGQVQDVQDELASKMGEIEENQRQIQKEIQTLAANVYNMAYSMFAADGNVNPVDGTYIRRIDSHPPAQPPKRTGSILFSLEQSRSLVDTWLSSVSPFDPSPTVHINTHLAGFPRLSPSEMDRTQYILSSSQLQSWLTPRTSSLLEIHSESAPDELTNALSFSSATLSLSLSRAVDAPVLSFFCGSRTKTSRNPAESGPMALWNALNGQLLSFIIQRRETADLTFLESKRLMRRSSTELKYGRVLFKKLLAALPEGDVVFVIVDSFSRLGGDKGDMPRGEEVLEEFAGWVSEGGPVVMKMLVTDTLPSCRVRRLADLSLRVPDEVDGWRNGVSVRYLEERREEMVGRFVREREVSEASEEEEEETDDFDSDSSDSDSD